MESSEPCAFHIRKALGSEVYADAAGFLTELVLRPFLGHNWWYVVSG